MAAVVTVTESWDAGGNKTWTRGTIALDSSYPTGGEAIDVAGSTGFAYLIAQPDGTAAGGAGRVYEWNAATQKLLVFFADYDAVADGALIQFTSTGDLSAITALPFLALSD